MSTMRALRKGTLGYEHFSPYPKDKFFVFNFVEGGKRKMLRKLIIIFALCFCVCLAATYLMVHLAGLSFDMRFLQIVILASLLLTNAIYLSIVLYKIDPLLVLIIPSIYYFYDLIYMRFYKDMDERLKSLYLLAGLLMTTIIVHLIQRRKSSPR